MPYDPSWVPGILHKQRITDLPPQYEIGESSQAPPQAPLRDDPKNDLIPYIVTQGDRLYDSVGSLESLIRGSGSTSLEQRVERLEEVKQEDTKAIHTLYHRIGANRTNANAMSVHYRALDYKT